MRLPINRPFDSSTIRGLHSAPSSRSARAHQVFPNTVDLALTGTLHYGRWN